MKLKLDENGHVVVSDGKPVYVHDDGKEIAFDAVGTVATISRLNGEAKAHREGKETAEAALKPFEGIADPKEALKALDVLKNLDAKKLVDAGEVDKVRKEAIKATEDKYAPILKERDDLMASLVGEKVGGSFSRSKFIADNLAIPADLAEARFGKNFKLEGNDVVAYDSAGNKLFSRSSPGEVAKFDEAMEILVDGYPYKDQILKGSGGSGNGVFNGSGNGGKRTVTRAQFDGLSADERASVATAASKGELKIID